MNIPDRAGEICVVSYPDLFQGDLKVIGHGFNSQVFKSDGHVLKPSKKDYTVEEAFELAITMQGEQRILATALGENMPQTSFAVFENPHNPEKLKILTMQEFVDGLHLSDYLALDPELVDIEQLLYFFHRSLGIYGIHGVIPDLANIETGFNVFRSRNVKINPEGENAHKPFLVDNTFGKTQRSHSLGWAWTRAIAWGVQRGIHRLQSTQ